MKSTVIGALMLLCAGLQAQKQLTNNGNFRIHKGGQMTVYGDFINNGAFADSGQVLTLGGTAAQKIGGTSTTTFKNLTLKNAAGSYLSANEKITGELNITSGTFSTTGYNFTLISDANGTARIAPILGNFTGNITMQRYLGAGSSSWRFLASPVSGVTLNDWQDNFITSGYPGSAYPNYGFTSIYTYDETAAGTSSVGYNAPVSASDVVTPGKGYWCYIGGTPITVDVTGPPAKFTQTFQVSYTQSAGPAEDGYIMIGNPYPSPIDWNSPHWTKTNINNAIYIWNAELQQYASWVSGVSVNGGSSRIASSQSFWIQAGGFNPALSCNENVKVSSSTPFLRPSLPASEDLKLVMEGNNYKDETFLRFGDFTGGYDSDADARKMFSDNLQVPGLASQDSTLQDMSVNSLPAIRSSVHIPVKAIVGTTGIYTIHIDPSSTLKAGTCLVLEDLVTGERTNLEAPASYSFHIEDTTRAARFMIHISAAPETKAFSASCHNYHDGKAVVKAPGAGPWSYQWSDAQNANLQQTLNTFAADTLRNLASGDYTVKITDVSGMCATSTVVTVSQPAPVIAGFIAGNSNLFLNDSLSLQNTSSGATSYSWDFGDGSTDTSHTPAPHRYFSAGTYVVKLLAKQASCADLLIRTVNVALPNTVDLRDQDLSTGISVYPNPGNGKFYVDVVDAYEGSELSVTTVAGAAIFSMPVASGRTEVNLMHLAKGIYLYRVALKDGKSYTGKLIIQ